MLKRWLQMADVFGEELLFVMVVKVVSSVHSENGGAIDTTAVDAMSTTSSTNRYCC